MKKALIWVVFGYLFIGGGVSMAAEGGLPFYKDGLNRSVRTKTQLVEQIVKNRFMITRAQLAERINVVRGTNLKANDVVTFIQMSDIDVVACKAGEKIKSDYYIPRSRTFSSFVRGCYDGEVFLTQNGEKFLSLMCGNTCVVEPTKVVAMPLPPKPVEERKVEVKKVEAVPTTVVQREDCRWVHTSNPSSISVGHGVGVWNSGSGVSVSHGVATGASHSQKSWVCN